MSGKPPVSPSLNRNPHFMLFRDKAIIRLESVDSTNNYAASLVKLSRPPEGTVITALEQTSGRGQRGNGWESTHGENLLMSVILYPPFMSADDLFALSQSVSIALSETICHFTQEDCLIKWPNDLIIRDCKVAGILIESAWTKSRLQSAVCGIGVNLNQSEFSVPHAASLRTICRRRVDSEEFLEQFMARLETWYLRLRTGQHSTIHQEYLSRLYRLNQPCSYRYLDRTVTATIRGVSRSGRLILDSEELGELSCDLKEISMVFG
jgi:BirA family transcriptional regulator, biotin operon repressor / biotin---[acetyl-CoA-carboxylase] ligase